MLKFHNIISIICSLSLNCYGANIDGSARWNLNNPIQIIADPYTPQVNFFYIGLRHAIEATGGTISLEDTNQKLYLKPGGISDKCENPNAIAYSIVGSTSNTIYVCDSQLTLNFNQLYADSQMMHEWGHISANRNDHLDCLTKAIMAPNYYCHLIKPYTELDLDYIFFTGNVINGIRK